MPASLGRAAAACRISPPSREGVKDAIPRGAIAVSLIKGHLPPAPLCARMGRGVDVQKTVLASTPAARAMPAPRGGAPPRAAPPPFGSGRVALMVRVCGT
eukprot:gene1810-8083_t